MARTAEAITPGRRTLALNRGEGGQNIIGTELFDALGVIRTEELLQARRLDGGEQFFTRAFDYGFSKTLEEATSKWDDREVSGTWCVSSGRSDHWSFIHDSRERAADGHGHHQMAGYLTPHGFPAAADPAQFPEQLAGRPASMAGKEALSWSRRSGPTRRTRRTQVQTGIVDPRRWP